MYFYHFFKKNILILSFNSHTIGYVVFNFFIKKHIFGEKNMLEHVVKNRLILCGAIIAGGFLLSSDAFGISTTELKEAMQNLKTEAFSWMFAVKIAAGVVGAAFSVARQSVTPFGIGAGVVAGIHFFDKYIGDGASLLLP